MMVTSHNPPQRLRVPSDPAQPDPPLPGHGPTKGRRVREYPAQSPTAVPCAECGTTGGRPHKGTLLTPGRKTGRRFKIDGRLCLACYGRLEMQRRRIAKARSDGTATNKATSWVPTEKEIKAACREIRADAGTLPRDEVRRHLIPRAELQGRALTRWLKDILRSERRLLLSRTPNDGTMTYCGKNPVTREAINEHGSHGA